jgi:hypothetical protein
MPLCVSDLNRTAFAAGLIFPKIFSVRFCR